MPVIRMNADHCASDHSWHDAGTLPPDAPIIVMVHGYRYSPSSPAFDPHQHILSLTPEPSRRKVSWPQALGFDGSHPQEGLAVAYGWEARGKLRAAYHRAEEAGAVLGQSISRLADIAGRPVALIGHSLGARVALQSLHHASPGSVGRIVLLTGAEFRDEATRALHTPAGRGAEVINITSRENDLFDFAVELWLAHGRRQALGFGLENPACNWVDVQIDHSETIEALNALGFAVERTASRLSHWTPYLRRGLFDFYRTALRQPWALPLPLLRARLPGRIEPRWSRLLAPPAQFGGARA